MNIINSSHLTSEQRSKILRDLVAIEKKPFKILVEPNKDNTQLMIIVGIEFETKEIAAEMKLKYF